jgi:hypothetical protein
MDAVLAALLGAILAGGFNVLLKLGDRVTDRRTAARLLLGDLYVLQHAFEAPLKLGKWPDREFIPAWLTIWRENRKALTRGTTLFEFAVVDAVYGLLGRMTLIARAGQPMRDGDKKIIVELLGKAPDARRVLLDHARNLREIPPKEIVMQRLLHRDRPAAPGE